MSESHSRSVAKGITWRVVASGTTMAIVYIFTGNMELVASVGALDVGTKIFFYYLHERSWGKVRWGMVRAEGINRR